MQSWLFISLASQDAMEEFCRRLGGLAPFQEADLDFLVDNGLSIISAKSEEQKSRFQKEAISKYPDNIVGIEHAGWLTSSLVKAALNPQARDDEIQRILADVKALDCPKGDERCNDLFTYMAKSVFEQSALLRRQNETRNAISGVLPFFQGFGSSVELRAVQPDAYQFGQDLDAYSPRIDGLIPVASLILTADSGKEFHFQVDQDSLGFLIGALQSTQKDLAALCGIAERLKSND